MAPEDTTKARIGISACLAGEAVRYDGGDKQQPLVTSVLAPHARLSPFCPEMAAGLGVPRPPVRLVETSARRVQAQGVEDASLDVTEALETSVIEYCQQQLETLNGFVFKSRSPSCGLGSAPLHSREGKKIADRDGLFAQRVKETAPGLPCVEENWLNSEARCWRFLAACGAHAYYRHRNPHFADLVALLASELAVETKAFEAKLESLTAMLLVSSGEASNAKTALSGRLSNYFTDRFSGKP